MKCSEETDVATMISVIMLYDKANMIQPHQNTNEIHTETS